jgi:hypothetical protein
MYFLVNISIKICIVLEKITDKEPQDTGFFLWQNIRQKFFRLPSRYL